MSRTSAIENFAVLIIVAVGMLAVVVLDRAGAPQKWHAAIAGTGVSLGGVAFGVPTQVATLAVLGVVGDLFRTAPRSAVDRI